MDRNSHYHLRLEQHSYADKIQVPDSGNREKTSFKDTNRLRVIEPPEDAWAYKLGDSPNLDMLTKLGPLPHTKEARSKMWCQNCYTMHDPALCLGPLKKGLLDICVICGGRHLVEDCLWFTKDNFMRYAWYHRQARPPVKTRVSLSDSLVLELSPAERERIVAAVQRPEFSRDIDTKNMDHCVGSGILFFWKSYDYGAEKAPEVEAQKAIWRRGYGVERHTILRIDPDASMAFGPAATMSAKQGEPRPNIDTHTNKRIEYVKAEKEKLKAQQDAQPPTPLSLEERLLAMSFKELEKFKEGPSKGN
ncbi:hypothetical protein SLS62_003753 [Diatrype stigma]|uniref:Uncharacterized protein n=1 Tax=Diatrype stigma TaxID=117547 RepID=A0AAN9YR19_9PEZI